VNAAAPIHIGCSGWNYASWKHPVYGGAAASRWLRLYAALFDTVEVNATFYRLPAEKAVQGWADTTPPDFVFAVKASRYLTHVKRLRDLDGSIERLYEPLRPLVRAQKLGPVLWQLPATFRRDNERLAEALAALPPGRHAFEFRHESWFVDETYDLLERHGAALVIGDHPERPFQPYRLTAPWTYIRFHYGHRGRDGNYSRTEIAECADRIRDLDVETWAYFNNDWHAFAVANARSLQRELGMEPRPMAVSTPLPGVGAVA
jgi:uncharacterized protein YecE (DUF72 family)